MTEPAAARSNPLRKLGSLRTLWPFVRRQRGLFAAWLVALSISAAATLSLPAAVKRMIDQGFSGDSQINQAFSLLFAVSVVLALATRRASISSPCWAKKWLPTCAAGCTRT